MRGNRNMDAAADSDDQRGKADNYRAKLLPERKQQAAPDHDRYAVPIETPVVAHRKPADVV